MKFLKNIFLLFIVCFSVAINAQISPLTQLYKGISVLVTGGCGFIGSHLVEKLVELGANVTVLDDFSNGSKENISTVVDQITLIQGSITDFDTCLAATQDKKIIFHLAAFVSVPISVENPYLCHNINIIGTQNILEAARVNNVKRFVFSSTCAIYGDSTIACDENMRPNPRSPYSFSKLIGEIYCTEYATMFDIETVMLRYFNVYGSRQNPFSPYSGIMTKIIYNIKHDLPITVFGDGTQTRDYVSVQQVVDANIFLGICEESFIKGEIFNIATEKSISVLDLIKVLKKLCPTYNKEIIFLPSRPGDVKHIAANCSKYNNLYKNIMEQFMPSDPQKIKPLPSTTNIMFPFG